MAHVSVITEHRVNVLASCRNFVDWRNLEYVISTEFLFVTFLISISPLEHTSWLEAGHISTSSRLFLLSVHDNFKSGQIRPFSTLCGTGQRCKALQYLILAILREQSVLSSHFCHHKPVDGLTGLLVDKSLSCGYQSRTISIQIRTLSGSPDLAIVTGLTTADSFCIVRLRRS